MQHSAFSVVALSIWNSLALELEIQLQPKLFLLSKNQFKLYLIGNPMH